MFTSLLPLLLPLYAMTADVGVSEAIGPLRLNPESPCWLVQAMGRARKLAERIGLGGLRPNPESASTGFCLATPVNGSGAFRCAVYLSEGDKAKIDLTKVQGSLGVQWNYPSTGRSVVAAPAAGGGDLEFSVPFDSDAVLYLSRQ